MTEYTHIAGLQIATELVDFVADEALSGTQLTPQQFWTGFSAIVAEFTAENRELLAFRDDLQRQLDEFYGERAGSVIAVDEHREFLERIGYLAPGGPDFEISTTGVDAEIATVAGPQLVVPVLNARFALNAANARWGSLYDALYGTDAISEDGGADRATSGYNAVRGARVVAFVRDFLDDVAPLTAGSHAAARGYAVVDGTLEVTGSSGSTSTLAGPAQLRGFTGAAAEPASVLIEHHGLHIELRFDRASQVGSLDTAGLSDVFVEAALTTIVDFEDSVAAVDAEDKVAAYRNWLGLNRGTLIETVEKGGRTFTRRLADDRQFEGVAGASITVPGRSLLLVRNVGSHMRTDAVLDADGEQIYETMLDAALTALCALPGRAAGQARANGTQGSIYIVKPKMHGPDEVALAVRLFARVETLLGLPPNTMKIGIMDEERRTTLNLKAAISAARERVIFVNTGFLDRSGDEIHTASSAGPIVAKNELKKQRWISAYEKHNVEVAIRTGLPGRAQIGKGMWAMPDLMADMLEQKIAQLHTGASTAWVPSPSAATLHALHYHRVDVAAIQRELADEVSGAEPDRMDDLLALPITDPALLDESTRRHELDDNVQSILGYVVRWVEHGVGCSKVPNLDGVALMEDRATLRISSQLLANWLAHGLISVDEVGASMRRMATVVDQQNAADPAYHPMAADVSSSAAFQAAMELVLAGAAQPNGYTEAILTTWRRRVKRAVSTS